MKLARRREEKSERETRRREAHLRKLEDDSRNVSTKDRHSLSDDGEEGSKKGGGENDEESC